MSNGNNIYSNRHMVSVTTLFLTVWVVLAYLSNIIVYSFSVSLLAMLVVGMAVVVMFSKHFIVKLISTVDIHFLVCWLVIFVSYIQTPRGQTLIDLLVLLAGYIIVRCYITNPNVYLVPLKILAALGIFFAVGVLLNYFMPSLFNICLGFLPSNFVSTVRAATSSSITGFTTNIGHSAGFIVVSIMAAIALLKNNGRNKHRALKCLLVLLGFALLVTGKRGHLVFIIVVVILCYLLPHRGNEKMKRYWKFFLVAASISILLVVMWDYLVTIPIFARLDETMKGLLAGEDVSSLRNSLSLWAIQIFKENPITGIGWNVYSTTVAGNVTYMTALDTHNIYLQLLCETGIIGFVIFVSFFIRMWIIAKNAYVESVRYGNDVNHVWNIVLKFAFMFQTFFLLYGFTGNPLYDYSWQIIYMFSVAICMANRYVKAYVHV